MRNLSFRALLGMALFIAGGCTSTVRLNEDIADYDAEIARLERELLEDPGSSEALRDLGAIYMRTDHPVEANEYLQRAYSLGRADGKTLFFLGLANETLGRSQTALRLYESYPDVSGVYSDLMQGRYDWLVREAARQEMVARLQDEAAIGQTEIAPDVVAVFPLSYQGADARYAPLGRGMAEMVMLDLQNVAQLRVVERVRLQALMNELQLAESGYIDSNSAPRMGLLLQAGRVVSGAYNVFSGDNLRVDASIVQTSDAELHSLASQEGVLDGFYQLEKQLVFDLLDEFGIEITEAEREEIQLIPTQNLQAFLAYCRGLQADDERDFEAAAGFFSQAVSLDPSFSIASARAEQAENVGAAGGTTEDLLLSAIEVDPFSAASPLDMLSNRLGMISLGVQSGFVPGQDARNPVAEQGTEAVLPTDVLRDPPLPPGGN